jgi:hypothetical protein
MQNKLYSTPFNFPFTLSVSPKSLFSILLSISYPGTCFGQYLRFLITAKAKTPTFLNSINPSNTQKPESNITTFQGLRCALDHTEYDLHADSHESLFLPNFSALLQRQCSVGWEYFLKGFLVKDWGYLQGEYYTHMKLNARKYNTSRWVVSVLMLLNHFHSLQYNNCLDHQLILFLLLNLM